MTSQNMNAYKIEIFLIRNRIFIMLSISNALDEALHTKFSFLVLCHVSFIQPSFMRLYFNHRIVCELIVGIIIL